MTVQIEKEINKQAEFEKTNLELIESYFYLVYSMPEGLTETEIPKRARELYDRLHTADLIEKEREVLEVMEGRIINSGQEEWEYDSGTDDYVRTGRYIIYEEDVRQVFKDRLTQFGEEGKLD